MPVTRKSSEVQQNFGQVVDQAVGEGDVIVERYGVPQAVIIGYHRYQKLLEAESALARQHLVPPDDSDEAKAQGQALATQIRAEFKESPDETLEEAMASLRGRS
jgi:prevent-host-death family protein